MSYIVSDLHDFISHDVLVILLKDRLSRIVKVLVKGKGQVEHQQILLKSILTV